jgi:hypothetical protein
MLRLKRSPTTGVSIVWRERTGPSKRLIAKALFYSLLIHLTMLLAFQIRARLFDATTDAPTPTVLLDAEDGTIALLGDPKTSDEDPRLSLSRHLHLTDSAIASTMQALPSGTSLPTDLSSPTTSSLPALHVLPWGFSDECAPSRYPYRVYPLRLSFHDGLRSLRLTDDGSRLFRKVTSDSIFITPAFSETHPTVEFALEVSAKTGLITKATCLRELFDKRLQTVAQRVIKTIRFEPVEQSKDPTVFGVIALSFSGTYDSISPFLEGES